MHENIAEHHASAKICSSN